MYVLPAFASTRRCCADTLPGGGTNSDAAYDGLHPNALGEYQLAQAFSRTLISAFFIGRSELAIPEDIPPRPLPTPSNIKAVSGLCGIVVTWDAVYGAFAYDLRKRAANLPSWDSCRVACNRYDSQHTDRWTWEYQVRASGGDRVKSPWSSVVSAVANPQTAQPPSSIVTHATPTGLTVSWIPPDGPFAGDIDRYGVITFDYNQPGVFPSVMGVRGEQAEINGLVPGHCYAVAVETWTSIGGGPPATARSVMVGRGKPSIRGVHAVAIDDRVAEIRWLTHPDAAGYRIWCRLKDSASPEASNHEFSICSQDCQLDGRALAPDEEFALRYTFYDGPSWDHQFAVAAFNGSDMSQSEWVDVPRIEPGDMSLKKGDSVHINIRYG